MSDYIVSFIKAISIFANLMHQTVICSVCVCVCVCVNVYNGNILSVYDV